MSCAPRSIQHQPASISVDRHLLSGLRHISCHTAGANPQTPRSCRPSALVRCDGHALWRILSTPASVTDSHHWSSFSRPVVSLKLPRPIENSHARMLASRANINKDNVYRVSGSHTVAISRERRWMACPVHLSDRLRYPARATRAGPPRMLWFAAGAFCSPRVDA